MKKIIFICFAASLFLTMTACGAKDKEYSDFFMAMDTFMELTAYGKEAEEAVQSAMTLIQSMDSLLSVTDAESEIFAINHSSTGERSISPLTFDLLESSLSLCERTGGALDISIYPVVRAWGFTLSEEDYRVPEDEELLELLELVDYNKITLGDQGQTVGFPKDMSIDLGAVAKGYAGDSAAERMKTLGVESGILRLGGNIQCIGTKPDGGRWRVGVSEPKNESDTEYLGILEVSDCAVVTSGGYERYFLGEDDSIYWHIIDPETGKPADNGIVSVTVVSQSGVLADGLSTALYVMGLDGAIEHYRANDDFEFVIVMESGEVYVSPNLTESFTLTMQDEYRMASW